MYSDAESQIEDYRSTTCRLKLKKLLLEEPIPYQNRCAHSGGERSGFDFQIIISSDFKSSGVIAAICIFQEQQFKDYLFFRDISNPFRRFPQKIPSEYFTP